MNFQITGKKMLTPTPVKKQTEPIVIQQKILLPKPIIVKQKQQTTRPQKPSINKTTTATKQKIKIQQIKKEQVKVQKQPPSIQQTKPIIQTIEQKQQAIQYQQKKQDIIGEVTIRYNHYKEKFTTANGILNFIPIEEKYSFAGVYKGNFIPVIKQFKTNQQISPERTGNAIDYSWKVDNNLQYRLEIQQDDQEEAKYQKIPYKAPIPDKSCSLKKNSRFEQITAMLKKMDPSEYGSAKYKQLLQQRDLQDVLFS